MLTMLETYPERRRKPLARLWRSVFRPPVEARISRVSRVAFVQISYEESRHEPDWRMISSYSLEPSRRLLAPVGFVFPESCELRRFVPVEFRRRMLENLALDALICSPLPPSERSVALLGREDEIVRLLPRIAPLVGELRIITRRPHAVAPDADRLCVTSGLPVTVTERPDAGDCGMLLAVSGGASTISFRPDTVVFSPDRPAAPFAMWVRAAEPPLPPSIEEAYSEKYDMCEYVGAFYELAGMRELGLLSPAFGLSDGGNATPEDIGRALSPSVILQ